MRCKHWTYDDFNPVPKNQQRVPDCRAWCHCLTLVQRGVSHRPLCPVACRRADCASEVVASEGLERISGNFPEAGQAKIFRLGNGPVQLCGVVVSLATTAAGTARSHDAGTHFLEQPLCQANAFVLVGRAALPFDANIAVVVGC